MIQAVLVEKFGISYPAISKWKTGKFIPDSGIMLELCDLLKNNVNELLSGERIMAELPPQICSYILADKSCYIHVADKIYEMLGV